MMKMVCAITICLLMFRGGVDKEIMYVEKSHPTTSISESINEIKLEPIKVDEFGRLSLPYNLQGTYSTMLKIADVEKMVGIGCMRDTEDTQYSVHKVGFENNVEGYCFISYRKGFVVDSWFVTKIPSLYDFAKVKKNKTTSEDIKKIDPATIVFDTDTPVSYHRFANGLMLEIRYANKEGKLVVQEYGLYQEPSGIVKKLLPSDLALVQ